MTNTIKIGIIQQSNSASIEDNRKRLIEKIKRLAIEGAQVVVLQELHDALYFCQSEDVAYFDLAYKIPGNETDIYSQTAREAGIVLVSSLFEKRAPGLYHNTAVVFDNDGSIAGKYRKMHIPDDPAYYEKFYFTPGDLGFEPINTSIGRLGVLVCWDQWYPEAARLMAMKGAEILIYPTAIGWESTDTEDEKIRQHKRLANLTTSPCRCQWIACSCCQSGRFLKPILQGTQPELHFGGVVLLPGPKVNYYMKLHMTKKLKKLSTLT